jgi:CheY-like chemotaxis protein
LLTFSPLNGMILVSLLPALAGAENMATARPTPPRVLVVDDHPDTADSLALLLRTWGYEPAVAYDGPAALALAEAEPPAAALLDLAMPGMDGCEVARRLHKLPGSAGALLIAVTSCGREEDLQRCCKAGFDLHVFKPFDPEEVRQVLAERLPPAGAVHSPP